MSTFKIAAFADEIAPDPAAQIRVLRDCGVSHIELRGAHGKNVLKLSDDELDEFKSLADEAGLGFSSIGSPIGKDPMDKPLDDVLAALDRAIHAAQEVQAPHIRVFGFFVDRDDDFSRHTDTVLQKLGAMAKRAEDGGVILQLENEAIVYNDTWQHNLELFETINSPAMRAAFDFANYALVDQKPFDDCWQPIKPWLGNLQIKDLNGETRENTTAGNGVGQIPEILADALADGFDGFITLEPHLFEKPEFAGLDREACFRTSSDALQRVLKKISTPA